jgi:hypothetical protein
VLATTLMVTTLLTVMLAASFLLVSAEERMTRNSFGSSLALGLAQSGLQSYFTQNRGITTSQVYDSVRVTLAGGYADVVSRQVRGAGATAGSPMSLWVVQSRGVATNPVMVGQVQSARTIAQLAQLNPGVLPARAAMVSLNGALKLVGGGGTAINPFSGQNFSASVPGCTNPTYADTFALSAPGGTYYYSDSGVPAPDGRGVEQAPFPAWSNLYDSTHIDWGQLVAGNFLPDYTIPVGGATTSPPWPPASSNFYLVVYALGNVTIPPSTGMRGMLVVRGNVTLVAGSHWDGIIVAGGMLNDSAGGIIHGMAITGLNRVLGMTVPQNNVPQGAAPGYHARVQWSYCYARGAVNSLANLVPVQNAWADTWSTY